MRLPRTLRQPLLAASMSLTIHCGLIAEPTYQRQQRVTDVQTVGDLGAADDVANLDAFDAFDAVGVDQPEPADVPDSRTRFDAELDVKDVANIIDAGPPPGPCGRVPPADGAICAMDGLICEYGGDPRVLCRPTARCQMGHWEVLMPAAAACPGFSLPGVCPPSAMDAQARMCPAEGLWCGYGGLTCHCTGCVSVPRPQCGMPIQWRCDAPNISPACPDPPPLLGTACLMENLLCAYSCETHGDRHQRVCLNRVWTLAPAMCARSSRAVKRDIVYLNDADVDSVARRMLQTPLGLHQQRFQSGLLEPSLSVLSPRPDFSSTDLYGYTSLVLATVQSQQRALEQLQQDVRRLQQAHPAPRTAR